MKRRQSSNKKSPKERKLSDLDIPKTPASIGNNKQYKYTQLSDCEIGSNESYNFYAVILDCSFPHKSYKSDRFICSMKIADPSLTIDNQGVIEYCTLVFFAKKFEDLPISQRIGDIIRLHRAGVGMFKNVKQFTANMFFNSSWAIFSPISQALSLDKEEEKVSSQDAKLSAKELFGVGKKPKNEFEPFTFFGKAFSFDNQEKKVITTLRKWIQASFAKYQMLSFQYITPLSEVKNVGSKNANGRFYDFDLQVKILQVFKIDDYSSEIRVIDESNEIWFCQLLNMKYRWVREGQVVRIRSANLEHYDKYERSFGLKPYSNILSLPYPCQIAKNMNIDYQANKELNKELLGQKIIMHPVIFSYINNPEYQKLPLSSLERIILEEQKKEKGSKGLIESESAYRTRFQVEAIMSIADDLTQLIKIFNKKQNKSRDVDKSGKVVLKKDEKLIYHIQLYCRDYSNLLSNQFVKIFISEEGGNGKNFFRGIKPEDIIGKKKDACQKLQEALSNILKFNVWIEAAIEITGNGYFLIRDTKLQEI